ncbi:MAG TPA: N-acetylmuramic acid 6-phosphate etherase [Planctomycetota bacterium]|nr:N-acetylmuramic acid 6-phosphate etherase [Planctomycetota bacterium]
MKRDFSQLSTERRNPRTLRIDALSVPEILDTLNREDATIAAAVATEKVKIARAVTLLVDRVKKGGRMIFVGAGTSGRLGMLEAAEIPPTFDTPPTLVQAVMAGGPECVWASREGAEDDAADGAAQMRIRAVRSLDAVIGISASGVTPFVTGALGEARKRGGARILVSCNRRGVPRDAADVHIAVIVGPEVITGSTRLRAGTATKLVLNMLTVATMVRLGKVYENLMVDLQTRSDKLVARAKRIVSTLGGIPEADATKALRAAGGSAKVAIVMLRRRLSRERAETLLREYDGMLRGALES